MTEDNTYTTGELANSGHTPRIRKLTCPCCGIKDWCVEHYHAEPLEIAPGICVPGTCACEGDNPR